LIRLFVVSPTRLYVEALAEYFLRFSTVEVVGIATGCHEAKDGIAMMRPDVVLIDAMMATIPGIVAALLGAEDSVPKLIAFAISDTPDLVIAWLDAGACGYLTSDTPLERLIPIIEGAARGELLCSGNVASALLRRIRRSAGEPYEVTLTARQREVIEHVARGRSNKEIARAMGISVPTVKNHLHNIFDKLQVHRRADALSRLGRYYN
jgi:DNA-binding NarL/FixJ family response regulator